MGDFTVYSAGPIPYNETNNKTGNKRRENSYGSIDQDRDCGSNHCDTHCFTLHWICEGSTGYGIYHFRIQEEIQDRNRKGYHTNSIF